MRILKYEVSVFAGTFAHLMPVGARILAVQTQANKPQMWVLVNDEETNEERRLFRTVLTGQTFRFDTPYKYVGTFQLDKGEFVGHLFELLNESTPLDDLAEGRTERLIRAPGRGGL